MSEEIDYRKIAFSRTSAEVWKNNYKKCQHKNSILLLGSHIWLVKAMSQMYLHYHFYLMKMPILGLGWRVNSNLIVSPRIR